MAFTRTASGLCVANLHATNDRPERPRTRSGCAPPSAAASGPASGPLVFGGDLNLRPAERPAVFAELSERFGLAAPTAPDAIDHLLVRGLEPVEPPPAWPPERRELDESGHALRLSDHAPVVCNLFGQSRHGARGMR